MGPLPRMVMVPSSDSSQVRFSPQEPLRTSLALVRSTQPRTGVLLVSDSSSVVKLLQTILPELSFRPMSSPQGPSSPLIAVTYGYRRVPLGIVPSSPDSAKEL